MRQIFKRVSTVCAVAACSAAMLMSGSVVAYAAEADETIVSYIQEAVTPLTEQIVVLSEEDTAQLRESGTEFVTAVADAWDSSKEELGAFVGTGDVDVQFGDHIYTATVATDFETYDANFVYIFDETGTPTTMTIDIQYPLSVNMKRAGMNTIMGIGTVFLVLVFLMFIISLFKYIPSGKKKSASAPAPAPAPAPVAAPVVEEEDDMELIAVIAAAIAASEGAASADGYVVRSIRKVNRKVR